MPSTEGVEENRLKNVLNLHRMPEGGLFFISSMDWVCFFLKQLILPTKEFGYDAKYGVRTFFAHNNIPLTGTICWNLN